MGQKFIKQLKRIKRQTPAVTRVDECTNAETGVGAAIAAGSQLENGIWALLVIAAKTRRIVTIKSSLECQKYKKFQWPW